LTIYHISPIIQYHSLKIQVEGASMDEKIVIILIKDTQEKGRVAEITSEGVCTIILEDEITCRTRNINHLEEMKGDCHEAVVRKIPLL
jgi:hypothetical protein